jgi:hypothetical protein
VGNCCRALLDLRAEPGRVDDLGLVSIRFAAMGGSMAICQELEGCGVDHLIPCALARSGRVDGVGHSKRQCPITAANFHIRVDPGRVPPATGVFS